MNERHGGNLSALAALAGRGSTEIVDFSASINPLGPPGCLRGLISRHLETIIHYPQPDCRDLRLAIAKHYGIDAEQIVVGNGSTELLFALPRAISMKHVLIPSPAYVDYKQAISLAGGQVELLPLHEANDFTVDTAELGDRLSSKIIDTVILGHPNNPTGQPVDVQALLSLAQKYTEILFVIDEAFADFIGDYTPFWQQSRQGWPDNIIILRSMTKFYAIPGLRVGFAVLDAKLAERLAKQVPPWTVNALAQVVGKAFLDESSYQRKTLESIAHWRQQLIDGLEQHKLRVYPGKANYLLARVEDPSMSAAVLAERLLKEGIAIRDCANFDGLDESFFRVAVRDEHENGRLLAALSRALPKATKNTQKKSVQKQRSIMIQGTCSDAGKSILTAGLCRVLLQDGLRVAPFKSQNMSLNSFVTRDGREMGRAQVVQAQACRLDPDVRMNPILLKPSSDVGSQIIVNGHPVGNMSVEEYVAYKPQAFSAACAAYDSLLAEHDLVVLEGAGSPAEVNLKKHDIVNMRMAQYAGASVLLVGDIDRGGVFASFVGTMEVMEEWERRLVAGFVVNKFRGRAALLGDAFDFTRQFTGREVLGVLPYLTDLGLPEEDSVSFKKGLYEQKKQGAESLEIAFVDLPHISNFTDAEALLAEPDVHLKVIRKVQDLETPAAVIIPGSKNVMCDMKYLTETGLAKRIVELAADGVEIVGICGGYQMLGRTISDPFGLESSGNINGLGLLDMATTLEKDKTLTRCSLVHIESGLPVSGYEIHHGQSEGKCRAVLKKSDGAMLGSCSEDAMIWGSYIHGIFDADDFRHWFVDRLRTRRGLPKFAGHRTCYDIEPALDRLAAVVRKHLDMDKIYRLIDG